MPFFDRFFSSSLHFLVSFSLTDPPLHISPAPPLLRHFSSLSSAACDVGEEEQREEKRDDDAC